MTNIARCVLCGEQIEYEGIFTPPKKCPKCSEKSVKNHYEPSITKEDVKKALEAGEDWYQSICDQIFNQVVQSHHWVEQQYEDLKKCIEFYPSLEKDAIYFKHRMFDGIDELRDHHIKQMKAVEESAVQLADKDKEILKLKEENRHLKTILNSKYGKYGDVRLNILHRLRDKFEDILDKALNNCSVNHKYYDQILDEIDKEIYQI